MSGDLRKWLLKPHQKKDGEKQPGDAKQAPPPKAKDNSVASTEATKDGSQGIVSKGKGRKGKSYTVEIEEAKVAKDVEEKPSPKKGRGRGKAKADKEAAKDDLVEEASPTGRGQGQGRGRGRGRGSSEKPAGGRGRGGGRGNFNFGAREAPPHKGEKEVPEGAENALAGLTFVISGTLDSLEREEAEDLIKRHGGRVTSAVSKKTSFLLADEDVGGQKSKKAQELGIPFLTEDGLFDKVRASKPKVDSPPKVPAKRPAEGSSVQHHVNKKPKVDEKKSPPSLSPSKASPSSSAPSRQGGVTEEETWPFKHRPKLTSDIIANQSIVKQLKEWLSDWDKSGGAPTGGKGKKAASSNGSFKKAVLLCGPPGIGKTTTARLLCEELGYEAIEVNASDSRGKADSKIVRGIGGSMPNAVKEMISNVSLGSWAKKSKKSVLIMDEVDGMSAGDRGGVTDLIASIKVSKIPIICICNDRYSQKLKSLVNYCLLLSYRKPTKQQMAKRLQDIAHREKLDIDTIALEELSDRTHGDMRLALNQLQYMSLHKRVLKYDDIKQFSLASGKDEDISPFSAVDKLMGFEGGRLKMDDRIDLAMSDMDLIPLIIQENYLNYVPSARDTNGTVRMDLLAQAATSIASADIFNVQIRRFRQWQLARSSAFMSSIIPASLVHGKREVLTPGERNFNRFGSWLGKNSTFGKNTRLLEDVHVHVLCSRVAEPTRRDLRLDYFSVLGAQLTQPLRTMDKNDAVRTVIDILEEYSLTQADMDSILNVIKFQGVPDPLDKVPPAVKAALTRGFTQSVQSRRVKTADLLPSVIPGLKKPAKKKARLVTPEDIEGEEVPKEDDEDEAEGENEGSNDEADEDNGIDALKMANAGYDLNVAGETSKGATRNGAAKAKQTKAKATAASKGASTSKGGGSKRKR